MALYMWLIRLPDGKAPQYSEVEKMEVGRFDKEKPLMQPKEPHAWHWQSTLSGNGWSAIGRTREEAEMLLRDAIGWGEKRAPELV